MTDLRQATVPASDLGSTPQRSVAQIGEEWLLTPERAAIHLPSSTAIIADLHLGYDLARCRSGDAVPITPLDEQWAPLEKLFSCHTVARMVIAGDLVEKWHGDQMACLIRDWLHHWKVELVGIVPGNHDSSIDRVGSAPIFEIGFPVGNWLVIHGDKNVPVGNVVLGHYHPSVRWRRHLTAPCFLFRNDRLVLPAFSKDAAGGNVFGNRQWRGHQCFVVAGSRVLDFGEL